MSVLVADGVAADAARAALAGLEAPVAVHRIADLDPDPEAHLDEGGALVGALLGALAPEPGELWLLRPDAHIAAVLDDVADLRAAVDRLLAR